MASFPPVPAPGAAPFAPQVLEAPAHWRCIDFLSDLHLQGAQPRTFAALRAHLLATPADAVFMLGDLFEAWVGDDAADEGFERECAELFAQLSRRLTLAFLPGNRDFLVGPAFLARSGVVGLADPTLLRAFGRSLLLTHGDALCLEDRDYQRFRATVRNPRWQAEFLAQPLARRREIAAALRAESRQRQGGPAPDAARQPDGLGADVDAQAALAWLQACDAPAMIHGHTHRPADHALADGCWRHVLSDWEFDVAPDRIRGDVLRLTGDGLQRLPVAPSPA
ncbi:UDP-2,3-diacylglucosamine diphosphatase [Caldimonas tepidiphila]|uniref:UDP-2,3-diacylglucosamine diphosphatase n=1 Tax=Caldimonas tepidiphila TaxID=2315841 RepID=UPI000E5A508F|nr:UDP-2,3-diacylglucosamine diphosphatase [Caldimonas tepidiphila]